MFGLASLDVLVGLITIYLVLSLACTAIVEAISTWMSLRSKKLEAALKELFAGHLSDGRPFVEAFYAHPLIQSLSEGVKGRPSYIPSEIVGKVVQALVMENSTAPSLKDAVATLPDNPGKNRIKGLLATFLVQDGEEAVVFRKSVEAQFDAVMDRASGWVKRRQQTVTLIVSVVLVTFGNVDTFTFATALSSSPELRARMLETAEQLLPDISTSAAEAGTDDNAEKASLTNDEPQPSGAGFIKSLMAAFTEKKPSNKQTVPVGEDDPNIRADKTKSSDGASKTATKSLEDERRTLRNAVESYRQARASLEDAGLRFGWESMPKSIGWATKIFGLLISIFAISLGAPFWFDVLKRFMQVRQSGASPGEKK